MDFALIMVLALGITGLIWALDVLFGIPRRRRKSAALRASGNDPEAAAAAEREPLLVEYARAFFPVILVVFLLRSFLVEPFRIPSGSMLPTLYVGDFILVNKFTYGIRIPVINKKIIDIAEPKRGDVMVFRFPENPSDNYIKRVIGLPGDRVVYRNKQLEINGKPMPQTALDIPFEDREGGESGRYGQQYQEDLDSVRHTVLLSASMQQEPMEFLVPPGHYFVMGDNRDHSNDSRYWGFVPEANLVGRAFLIWFSWDAAHGGGVNWRRIGNHIQ